MGSVSKPLTRTCARCGRVLSRPRSNARKKYCARCEQGVKRERSEKAHRTRVAATYGIDIGDYDRLYAFQGGRCYICRRATGKTRRLAVDHDHKTGKVRGLICKTCNWLLGHSRDSIEFFQRCIEYLSNPPAESVIYGGESSLNSRCADSLRGRRDEAAWRRIGVETMPLPFSPGSDAECVSEHDV